MFFIIVLSALSIYLLNAYEKEITENNRISKHNEQLITMVQKYKDNIDDLTNPPDNNKLYQ